MTVHGLIIDRGDLPSFTSQGVRDWILMVGVALLVGIDLTIIITFLAVEGSRGNILCAELVPNRENPEIIEGVRKQ